MRIAIDAMGGDFAPRQIIDGALGAARHHGCGLVIVGRRDVIEHELRRHRDLDALDVEIADAPDQIFARIAVDAYKTPVELYLARFEQGYRLEESRPHRR